MVKETLRRSAKIVEECQKQYFNVTYDLAMAKVIAMRIRSAEDEFSHLFIHLGSFDIMLSFFKEIGKFINSNWKIYSQIVAF